MSFQKTAEEARAYIQEVEKALEVIEWADADDSCLDFGNRHVDIKLYFDVDSEET